MPDEYSVTRRPTGPLGTGGLSKEALDRARRVQSEIAKHAAQQKAEAERYTHASSFTQGLRQGLADPLPSLAKVAEAIAAFSKPAAAPPPSALPGTRLKLEVGGKAVHLSWPYPADSRHGGPEKLSTQGDMNRFRDYMEPFANYLGAGTRGSAMMWVGDQMKQGALPPGSPATRQLAEIASTLFWDVPMQQNSDENARAAGIPADLSKPEAMLSYLSFQKAALSELMAKQDASDGPVHRQAAHELLSAVDGALARAEAFAKGDRSHLEAQAD